MRRARLGNWLAIAAGLAFVGTAGLHATGYDSVTALAVEVPSELASLVPALWLVFSVDLVLLGLIVIVVTLQVTRGARLILSLAALAPLGAAGLQVLFLGFIPPTAILVGVAVLTLSAAAVRPSATGMQVSRTDQSLA